MILQARNRNKLGECIMSNKNKNKRVEMGLIGVATCIVVAGLWAVLATPKSALAKKPSNPEPVVLWDTGFVRVGELGKEIVGFAPEAADCDYRTLFCDGSVVVTLSDGTVLDQKPFLKKFTDDTSGEQYLAFRIGIKDGHQVKDRCSTPTPSEGIGDPGDTVIPFPTVVWYDPDPLAEPADIPSLQVLGGDVYYPSLNMQPGAHVKLHLHVSGVPLIRVAGSNVGETIGTISIGDIEFTVPE
jgi:hypothetical protein